MLTGYFKVLFRYSDVNSNNSLKNWRNVFLFRIVLDLSYACVFARMFNYDLNIQLVRFIFSYLSLFVVLLCIGQKSNTISSLTMQMHFLVIYLPLTSYYGLSRQSTLFMNFLTICFLIQAIITRLKPFKFKCNYSKGSVIVFFLLFAQTILVYLKLLKTHNISIYSFNFAKVYSLRSDLPELSTLMGYFVSWQYRVINPFFIVYGNISRRKAISILFITLQILMFLLLPFKEIIVSIAFLGLMMFILSVKNQFFLQLSRLFTLSVILSTLIAKFLSPYVEWIIPFLAIFPTRFLIVPSVVKFQHYDFFSVNDKLLFSEGFIGKIFQIKSPYPVTSGFLVGSPTSNENAGFIAYAYDNLGFFNMIVMSILFIFILKLFDSVIDPEDSRKIFAFLSYPLIMLNDGDLFTILLTGGLFLSFFIVVLSDLNYKNRINGVIRNS